MIHHAKITSKGQVTIPAAVREELGLKKGDTVYFFETIEGKIVMSAKTLEIQELAGCLSELPDADPITNDPLVADDDRTRGAPRGKDAAA